MNSIKALLLMVMSTWTFTVFGQVKYIITSNGRILDTATYANMKAERIQQMKNVFPSKDVTVTIKDNFKEVRRTQDSLIYSYKWDIQIGDIKPSVERSLEQKNFLDKEFPLPSFTTLDNKKINIDSLKGKPTLINFWFTTCKPCIEEMPVLNAIKTQLKDSVNFVAITFESTEKARSFLKRHTFNFAHIANARKFTESMNMYAFPVNIFLDKDGIVRKVERGIPYILDDKKNMKMGDGKEFLEALRELL